MHIWMHQEMKYAAGCGSNAKLNLAISNQPEHLFGMVCLSCHTMLACLWFMTRSQLLDLGHCHHPTQCQIWQLSGLGQGAFKNCRNTPEMIRVFVVVFRIQSNLTHRQACVIWHVPRTCIISLFSPCQGRAVRIPTKKRVVSGPWDNL